MQTERQAFYEPKNILHAVQNKIKETKKNKVSIDYLTFVPDGEPTLDINLEHEIDLLKPLKIPIAVITNSSLIWQKDVQKALMKADWVSLKLDAVEEKIWQKIDRPHKFLKLDKILNGALKFSHTFKGKLMTETMLLANTNYTDPHLKKIADFLTLIQPTIAYISIPTRPPAEEWAKPPDENIVNKAYQIFKEKINHVEYLTGYEGNAFALTGNVEEDILSITSVHPMRDDAVDKFLKKAGADWNKIKKLIKNDQIIETKYNGHKFYLRKFKPEPRTKN